MTCGGLINFELPSYIFTNYLFNKILVNVAEDADGKIVKERLYQAQV